MLLASFEARIAELTLELSYFHGYRSLWLSTDAQILHTEPEQDLRDEGCSYLTTLLRPGLDELSAALTPLIVIEWPQRAMPLWRDELTPPVKSVLQAV